MCILIFGVGVKSRICKSTFGVGFNVEYGYRYLMVGIGVIC